jgi:hypothetical protein
LILYTPSQTLFACRSAAPTGSRRTPARDGAAQSGRNGLKGSDAVRRGAHAVAFVRRWVSAPPLVWGEKGGMPPWFRQSSPGGGHREV